MTHFLTDGIHPVCKECKRPMTEEEIDLNGVICDGCDHYEREMRNALDADPLHATERGA
jgi:hypothetical protein